MTHPNDPQLHDSISVIEDLDPEPEEKPGLSGRREVLVGGLLLALVVFFAVWQWWRQDYQANQYRAGKDAIAINNWDAAVTYFQQASGYNDADVLAANAQQMVEQRDKLYESANKHIDSSEWLQALGDIRSLARIQPSYRDLDVREKLATEKVYDDALGGTVVMRRAANPAGLYYRTPTAWVWLQGSDTKSTWLANEGQDHIVFDVASEKSMATPTPTPTPNISGIPNTYIGRSLVDAKVEDSKLSFSKVSVDPGVYPPIYVGDKGLWAINGDLFQQYAEYIYPFVRSYFWGSALTYNPYNSEISATIELTTSTTYTEGTVLTFVDPNSNRYLMAHWTNGHAYGPDKDTVINLYAGAAGDDNLKLAYTHTGGRLESAQLSPDGRYLVVTTQEEYKQSIDRIATSILDLGGTNPPRILKEVFRYSGSGDLLTLTAAFVSKGVYEGKLVLAEYGGVGTQLSLIDPAQATGGAQAFYTLSTTTILGDIETSWYITQQNQDGIVVTALNYKSQPFSAFPVSATVQLLVLPSKGLPETYAMELADPTSEIPTTIVSKNKITLNVRKPARNQDDKDTFTVYEVARSADARGVQPMKEVFSIGETEQRDARYNQQTSLHMGRTLIAYTHQGELRARTKDGSVDLVMEAGSPVIYENIAFAFYNYLLH